MSLTLTMEHDSVPTTKEPTAPMDIASSQSPISIVYHKVTTDSSDSKGTSLISLKYLAEGAANVVFSFHPYKAETGRSDAFEVLNHTAVGQVLRISKGIDKALTGTQVMKDFEETIIPIFRQKKTSHHLLDLQVVNLPAELIEEANRLISSHTSSRGTMIPPDTAVGLLMPNMSSVPGESLTIEIKPKWLLQSPTAPEEASYRCRTCALRAQKQAQKKNRTSPKLEDGYVCPLKFPIGNPTDIQPFMHHKILRENERLEGNPLHPTIETRVVDAMTEYFSPEYPGYKLINCIRKLQEQHDPQGVTTRSFFADAAENAREILGIINLGQGPLLFTRPPPHQRSTPLPQPSTSNITEEKARAEEDIKVLEELDKNLRVAMSLRDCSLFVRANYSGDVVSVEAKLVDLDLKSERKISEWERKETQLINGLYYKGLGGGQLDRDYTEDCLVAERWRAHVPRNW
ncbi:inositol-pentakisphosphate 2-kinase [Dendryphion nanum]|uniref:Inositol-pentakisphosphate 2-kinase n=1 Tax=Dendryphion nanum TaxID=256645 RepID=A0A9P9D5R1_9PLEO|nr:inositol-pentakisphosphate 2-kinase [Dendryphion nanum]